VESNHRMRRMKAPLLPLNYEGVVGSLRFELRLRKRPGVTAPCPSQRTSNPCAVEIGCRGWDRTSIELRNREVHDRHAARHCGDGGSRTSVGGFGDRDLATRRPAQTWRRAGDSNSMPLRGTIALAMHDGFQPLLLSGHTSIFKVQQLHKPRSCR